MLFTIDLRYEIRQDLVINLIVASIDSKEILNYWNSKLVSSSISAVFDDNRNCDRFELEMINSWFDLIETEMGWKLELKDALVDFSAVNWLNIHYRCCCCWLKIMERGRSCGWWPTTTRTALCLIIWTGVQWTRPPWSEWPSPSPPASPTCTWTSSALKVNR